MMKTFSPRLAGNILLIAFVLLTAFHVLVLAGIAPGAVVWGGMAGGSPANLLMLESIALLATAAFAGVVAIRLGYIQAVRLQKLAKVGVWLLLGYLVLNMVGNLASGVSVENLVFAPITILLALCALRLALAK